MAGLDGPLDDADFMRWQAGRAPSHAVESAWGGAIHV
jgi:hypothetical protein